jgi:uncharacterized damage-inducible protein DinB
MKTTEAIARHILDVHTGKNWTEVGITDTLEDVTLDEANRLTPASANTIATLLYHITFYNEIIEERLQGHDPYINEANGFDMPPLETVADWEKLKEDNLASARRLAKLVNALPAERLHEPILPVDGASSYYKHLHGVVEHTHYHLGQIVLLKNLIRNT